jgi:CRISPR-associated endonuclease Cas2
MTYLICYDISDDALRSRLAKRLERAGCVRLQKSVFIVPNFDARRLGILRGALLKILQEPLALSESVLLVPIERDNLSSITLLGETVKTEELINKVLFTIM